MDNPRPEKVAVVEEVKQRLSDSDGALLTNFHAVIDELNRAKPASAKGRYIKSATVSTTMGPGVKIDPGRLRGLDEETAAAV